MQSSESVNCCPCAGCGAGWTIGVADDTCGGIDWKPKSSNKKSPSSISKVPSKGNFSPQIDLSLILVCQILLEIHLYLLSSVQSL